MTEPKFLVVRLGSLGDIVHTFPAVAALRESFPNAKIDWLTHPRWKDLVAAAALADEIVEVETRSLSSIRATLKRIRSEEISMAIDYQGLWKSAAIPFFARVPRRIGFASASVREFGVPVLYSECVKANAAHVADKNGQLSLRAGAMNATSGFSLEVPPDAKRKIAAILRDNGIKRYVVLSPGGGWASKCWPPERFGDMARRLFADYGLRCVVNFGPGEQELASRVVAGAGTAAASFPYSGDFGELMAILLSAECVVAGDTGPLHLADALGARVVTIFGPTDPTRNGPYLGMRAGDKAVVLRAADVESTYKRENVSHPSILRISVDDVISALRSLRVIS